MKAWTAAAKDELNRFLMRIRQPLEQAGADAAEVIEDIKRHIDEEVAASRLRVVTVTELQPMLSRIGEPWNREGQSGDKASAALMFQALQSDRSGLAEDSAKHIHGVAAVAEAGQISPNLQSDSIIGRRAKELKLPKKTFPTKPIPGVGVFICGVIMPLATLLIELITGFCATNIFDPIPTWGHTMLVVLVPMVNALAWHSMRRDSDSKYVRQLASALGASMAVSIVYSIVFLPLAIPGIIALIVGIGLLPLSPYFSLGAAISLRTLLKKRFEHTGTISGKLRFYPGILGALAAFGLLHISFVGTTTLMRMAGDSKSEESAIQWLQMIGSEQTILEACYDTRRRPQLWVFDVPRVDKELARRVYFQVYGRAFNSVPKPGPRTFAAWDFREDWDPERGGDKVGAPVPHLTLASSRIDATVEPHAALSYLEWIVEFNNAGVSDQEARCEIALPPGAMVSRLTLWINGEEREAAFAGKAQVREAYQNVVVVQRRDPVLVTSTGKDRILMQCFPVLPNQRMKMRVGMTVPLLLDAEKNGILPWPYIRERNFALDDKLEHSFWIDSPMPIETLSIPLQTERTASGHYMARGTLNERKGGKIQPAVLIRRNPEVDTTWVRDTRANDGSVIVQSLRERAANAVKDIVLVIDGSVSLRELAPKLEALEITKPLQVVVAGERVQEFTVRNAEELARELKNLRFSGGRDNVPALERAWDLAAQSGSGAIVWIHGPQPLEISSTYALVQRFERRWKAVQLYDLPVEPAPNAIAAALPTFARYELVSMHRPADKIAGEVLRELMGASTRYEMVREKAGTTPIGVESNLHLARLWAFDEIERLVKTGDRSRAIDVAALYQLVSEVSGAVVLETAEQYRRAGLEPVSAKSVPVVPEPGTWALMIMGALLLSWYRRRQQKPSAVAA